MLRSVRHVLLVASYFMRHVLTIVFYIFMNRCEMISVFCSAEIVRMQANIGVSVSILDPTDPAPASVAAKQMVGSFTDADAIKTFVKNEVIDVLTVEIEHINVDALMEVQSELGTDIQPTPSTLRIIQDKYAQKEFFNANDIAVVEFIDVPDQVC
jgi:phosphoribosylaminoimidazole carboxylase